MSEERVLKEGFNRRYRSLLERSRRMGIEPPPRDRFWRMVLQTYRDGFRCQYCSAKMLARDPEPPYYRAFSIDHVQSLDMGGDNTLKNLTLACHRCNIIKGTMTGETFLRMLHEDGPLLDNPKLLDRIFKEIWKGRLANKLERNERWEWNEGVYRE